MVFFSNDTATTEIYTPSLHDALPIYDHMANWTKSLKLQLGTFESPVEPGLGATWPWDMRHGFEYMESAHNLYVDYAYSYDITPGGDPDATALARSAITEFGKPAIIGYWDDVHYDLA